ncbi:MAG: universal stress protein [Pseudomonadota bacterium]
MRILFAADEHPYSAGALPQVARLGKNTFADITILGVSTSSQPGSAPDPLQGVLEAYRDQILASFDPETSPYGDSSGGSQENNVRKRLVTRVAVGNPSTAILDAAKDDGSDLIVIGCSAQDGYAWEGAGNVPLKVARDADCSVLVIKENREINRVICCLDHDKISQYTLEMVNQVVTLFHADLDLVVLTETEKVPKQIEQMLFWFINYYTARTIFPRVELVKPSSFETFAARRAASGLLAMWMGPNTILGRLFPSNKIPKFLKTNESSVILLK